jgi:hypothetical protein
MNLTVLRNGQQLYVREQAFGGNQLTQDIARLFSMSFEEAETEKRRNNLPEKYETELLRPFLEALALELSRACSSSSPRRSSTRSTILFSRVDVQSSRALTKWLLPEHRSTRSLPTRLPTWCFPSGFAARVCWQMLRH